MCPRVTSHNQSSKVAQNHKDQGMCSGGQFQDGENAERTSWKRCWREQERQFEDYWRKEGPKGEFWFKRGKLTTCQKKRSRLFLAKMGASPKREPSGGARQLEWGGEKLWGGEKKSIH